MKCPHCNKRSPNDYHHLAETNAEAYGSGSYIFQCRHCKEKYSFYVERMTKVFYPEKVDKEADLSFGH